MFFKLEYYYYSTQVQEMMPEDIQIHSIITAHYPVTSIIFENLGTKIKLYNYFIF